MKPIKIKQLMTLADSQSATGTKTFKTISATTLTAKTIKASASMTIPVLSQDPTNPTEGQIWITRSK